MSKLGDFLKTNKIDSRRVVSASKKLEALRPEDRALKSLKARVKAGGEGVTDADKEAAKKDRRSGKPVTPPLLDSAVKGETVSGPAKTRIVRAVNAVLSQKKKGAKEIGVRDLF